MAPPIDDERRLVTALFCDLVGFTPLSERLDAEELRELQTRYFELIRTEIARFGGQVEKYAGDAVLALFGLSAAREDDAERAVRCAVSMLAELQQLAEGASERWGARLALRVGVNTGEAVGGAPDVEGAVALVTGDVVNTAARLQTAAPPNGIMVGVQTMQLARRSIAFGEAEYLELKGKAGKVPAYRVIEIRGRMAERWEAGRRRTPLLGREHDIDTLLQSWERARQGNGQLIMIVAEAGVGKSRLLAEVAERMSLQGDLRELRGRCSSHGEGVSLGLVADLLRTWLDVREQDDLPQIRARLASRVADVLAAEDEGTRLLTVDVLGEVLGLAGR